jgi:hypothetical protein
MKFKGKILDTSSLEVDGIDTKDYPDFCDAYFSFGLFEDGTKLSDDELDDLSKECGALLHEKVFDSLH